MPHTGLKCLNANFIYYASHLPWGGGGEGFFLFIQNGFYLKIYTYNLLQAFPQNHL